jgi:putative component of membrane protein insertase Oxa1/YidC/SpoIIIJ protein YidD
MEITYLEPLAKKTAINSITTYQHYISPHKGFSCPHRLLHGGDSCSKYVKRMLSEQSLVEAVQSSLQRFKDCAHASTILTTRNSGGGCIVIPCCIPL